MKSFSKTILPVLPMLAIHMFIVIVVGWFGINVIPHGIFWDQQPHQTSWLLDMFSRWDTGWYAGIAINGYSDSATPYFPLFPLILSLFPHTLTVVILAGFIISFLAFVAALVFLRLLVIRVYNKEIATRTLWILALFPGSLFLTAVYPMSLFLLFIVLFFYGIITDRYWLSFFAGFLAASIWNSGFVLAFSGLYVLISSYRKEGFRPALKKSLTVIGPALALGLYAIYLWVKFGTPFAAMHALGDHFKNEMAVPVLVQLRMVWIILTHQQFPLIAPLANTKYIYLLDTLTCFSALALLITMIVKRKMVYTIPYLLVALFMLMTNAPTGMMTTSATRYVTLLFPFWIVLGTYLNNVNRSVAVLVISTTLLVLNMILFSGGYFMT